MAERKIVVEKLKTTTPGKEVQVEVYYAEGGRSFFTGEMTARGYWMSATAVDVKEHLDEHTGKKFEIKTVTMGSGVRQLLEETKRFSQKRLMTLAHYGKGNPARDALVRHVLARHSLQLVDKDAVPAPPLAVVE